MPLYLTRFSYTPETWARLIGNPEDRRKAAQSYIESVGGKLHGFWYAFGDHDGYNLWEAPDNVSMAAVALAIRRRRAQLVRNDCAPDRRGNDGRPAQGRAGPVPGAWRVVVRVLRTRRTFTVARVRLSDPPATGGAAEDRVRQHAPARRV